MINHQGIMIKRNFALSLCTVQFDFGKYISDYLRAVDGTIFGKKSCMNQADCVTRFSLESPVKLYFGPKSRT